MRSLILASLLISGVGAADAPQALAQNSSADQVIAFVTGLEDKPPARQTPPPALGDVLRRLEISERENDNLARRLASVLIENQKYSQQRSVADKETIARVGRANESLSTLADGLAERNLLRDDVQRLRDLLEATGRLRSLDLQVENDDLRQQIEQAQTDLARLSGIIRSKGIDISNYPAPQNRRLLDTNLRLSQQNTILINRVNELEAQLRAATK